MLKIILILLAPFTLCVSVASEQLVVVLSPDLNATATSMQRYDKNGSWMKRGDPITVTLGRSGLGYVAFK